MTGAGDTGLEPNGLLTGDAGLSTLLSSGDVVPESEPDDEVEMSSVPSVPGTDLAGSDCAIAGWGGEDACFPAPDVN